MQDMFQSPARQKQLRPHQERAIALLRQEFERGLRRVVLQGATGFGKTLVAVFLIRQCLARGGRVVMTVPLLSLIPQTLAALRSEGITDVGVIQGNHHLTNSLAGVQIASVDTLSRRDLPAATLVIVDECHITRKVILHWMRTRPELSFVGLSATPWAPGMGRDWQALVVPITLGELIAQGYLSRFRVYAPDVPDLSGVALRRGDYAEAALQGVMGRAPLMGSVVRTWLEKGQDRPTLCFAVNRAHAQQLAAEFERHGVAADHVDAYTDMVARQRITEAFRAGEVRVICSVRTMTTGIDLPVSCIIDAAPTRSEILHVQKIGRGLRVGPETEDCVIFDHAGNSLRLGLVPDIHHARLDDGALRRGASASVRRERLPTACLACGVLFTGRVCPACDHERRPVCRVEAAAGELVPLAGSVVSSALDDPTRFYRMALWLDARRGKGGKLALGLFKERFGHWPRFGAVEPVEPDRAFLNWETAQRIAYARARSRREHELA